MDTETIKSFLVGLGFGVDDSSLAKFNKAIASASVKVATLAGSVQAAAAGIFYGISKVSQSFENMGYELRLVAPAMNRFLVMRQAMLTAYAKAGVNLTKVVQQSILFNYSLAKTKFALEAVWKSVAARFFPMLTKQMDIFRSLIFKNMPKIQGYLEKMIKAVFKAFTATLELGHTLWDILSRLYGFFAALHDKTNGWSTAILGALAAWKLFNLGFLATPLGMILSLAAAVLLLYDDFKIWSEGGKSLINWGSSATKVFVGLAAGIAAVATAISVVKGVTIAYNAVLGIMDTLLAIAEAPFWAIAAAVGAVIAALTLADDKWKIFGGNLSGFFEGVGGKVLDWFSGANANAAQNATTPAPLQSAPSNKSMAINQETNINVMGVADAHGAASMTANAQNGVNRDMVRYGQGSFFR